MTGENTERGFWEEFLEKYKQLPCLWNTKSSSYGNKILKQNACENLTNFCKPRYAEANHDFVKKKIHNFRYCYRRELNKVRKSKRTWSGAEDLYVSSLWYFHILSFLHDDETPRSGLSNWNVGINNEDSNDTNITEDNNQSMLLQKLGDDDINITTGTKSQAGLVPSLATSTSTEQRNTRKRKNTLSSQSELIDLANKTLRGWSNSDEQHPTPDDHCDITGRKVAADLRQMTDMQRMVADKIISEVCFYGKAGLLRMGHSFAVQPPYENITNPTTQNQLSPGVQTNHFQLLMPLNL